MQYRLSSITSKIDPSKKLYAYIKPLSFKRAVGNLIDNALKYGSKSTIEVMVNDDQMLEIIIEDDGPGIDEVERKKVMQPFYRVDKSRSLDKSPSVGLGLAITKEIILSHKGKIFLDKSPNLGGLMIKILIPLSLDLDFITAIPRN
jgi:two-component system osmolarity sensor histidine kinase EnvZ